MSGAIFALLLGIFAANAQPPPLMADYNRAWRVAIQGRFDEALPMLAKIIDRDPKFWRAYRLIADTALTFGKLDEAESFFESLRNRRPSTPYPWYGLALVALNRGDFKTAAERLRQCIHRAPDACACYEDLAVALSNGKNGPAAVKSEEIGRLLPAASASPCLGIALAEAHAHRFEFPQTIEIAETGLHAAEQTGNADLPFSYLGILRAAHEGQGNLALSFEESRRLLELAEALGDESQVFHQSGDSVRQEVLKGNLEAALELSESHLARARKLNAPALIAERLTTVAHRLDALGDVLGAIEREREAVEQYGRTALKAGASNTLGRISERYLALGLADDAVESARQAVLELQGETSARGTLAFAHRSLGRAYEARGDYFLALQEAEKSISIFQELGLAWQAGAGIGKMGELYTHLGDLDRASRYTTVALDAAVRHADAIEQQNRLAALGELSLKSGRPLRAVGYFTRAANLSTKVHLPLNNASAVFGLGQAQAAAGKWGDAEKTLEKAHAAFRSLGLPVMQAEAWIALGSLALKRRRLQEAENRFRAALELAESVQARDSILAARRSLAQVAAMRGDLHLAVSHSEAALREAETLRGFRPDSEYRAAFVEQNWRLYENTIDLLWRLHQRDRTAGYDRRAFEVAERGRARSLLDTLAESRIAVRKGLSAQQARRQAELFSALSQAAEGLLKNPGADGRRRYDETRERVSRWVAELRAAGNELAEFQYPESSGAEDVRRAFTGREATLLQYALGEKRSFVWVVRNGALRMFALPPRPLIEAEVRRYRNTLIHPPRGDGALAEWRQQAAFLHRLLMPPAAISGDGGQLEIVPDGILHYLPFETLVMAGRSGLPAPVIEKWSISYAPSASVYLQLKHRRPAVEGSRKELLAYGDPVFPEEKNQASDGPVLSQLVRSVYDSAGVHFRRLPNTGEEVRRIGGLFPVGQRKLVVRAKATEDAFKREDLATFKRIHFATHAILDERMPSRSGVVLSSGAGRREDGVLRLNEIFNLKLDSDLVVLSACQTGLGKMVRGEGIVGLTRGFLYAGAPRVVVSLWEVNDMAAPAFMQKFYAGIKAGASPADALRAAKLAMLNGPAPLYTHPYYWAPFVSIGAR